jgi:acid-sensing ion channel, other
MSRLIAVSQVCDSFLSENMDPENRTSCVDCVKNLKEMAVPLVEMLMSCSYNNNDDLYFKYFEEIITEEGICYTFNALRMTDIYRDESISEEFNFLNHSKMSVNWTMEEGYKKGSLLDDYPRRAMGAGARVGLSTLLYLNASDLEYICRGPAQGFKVSWCV